MAMDPTGVLRSELQGLNLKSPESDAARDMAQGHPHCYSTNGAGRIYWGVSTSKDQTYCAKIEKNFRGTSDEIWGKEHYRLILQAEDYAKRYNTYVLSHRK